MPQKNRIVYTPVAVDDMDEIFSYISKDNINAVQNMLERIDKGIKTLERFPNMGSVLSDDDYTLVQRGYRFIVIKPYLVFYRFKNNNIIIHRILHGRRDYLKELFERS